MSKATDWIDRRFFPTFGKNWDDNLFRNRIFSRLSPQSVVLDLGAGAGIVACMDFRGHVARICGVDLDPRVTENPYLDEGLVTDGRAIPYPDETFDVVFSDNVLEHLPDPNTVFAEVFRVLKPGGRYMFKTPNKTHYVPLISKLTPHRFHSFVNRKRGRASEDTFPTYYRANSRADVCKIALTNGFLVESIELIEGRPEYLRMTAATYAVGLVYERLVNAFSFLESFRVLLIGVLRKES
ncbi:class I SAM-dependent methyltransferase [Mesorhizobium sp. M1163]|uniref:class I SAM-dependent methyltransferase n=1 Tax=Mesorhizobium sp. M1163 TaxID=2957065 RepID=UPI003337AFB5